MELPITAGDRIFLSEGEGEILEVLNIYRDGTLSARVQLGDGERVYRRFAARDVIPLRTE